MYIGETTAGLDATNRARQSLAGALSTTLWHDLQFFIWAAFRCGCRFGSFFAWTWAVVSTGGLLQALSARLDAIKTPTSTARDPRAATTCPTSPLPLPSHPNGDSVSRLLRHGTRARIIVKPV